MFGRQQRHSHQAAVSRILHSNVLDQRRESSWNQISRERKFTRTFVPGSKRARHFAPGSERSRERNGQGTNGPRSEWARERIGQGPIGRFAPESEWARERKGIGLTEILPLCYTIKSIPGWYCAHMDNIRCQEEEECLFIDRYYIGTFPNFWYFF